jgi:predicted nucleic acid-binding protein
VPRALVRAVVDTNILVRGILRRREAAAVRVFDALVRGDFRPLVSDYILIPAIQSRLGRTTKFRPILLPG